MPGSSGWAWEKMFAAAAGAWILILHLCCFQSAGALWRDEANSANQALLPSVSAIGNSLQYDSFPALYPVALRAWIRSGAGDGDRSFRIFGLITGMILAGSLWSVGKQLSGRAPILCLALAAADPVVISEGDSLRPYGISAILLVWMTGLFGRLASRPTLRRLFLLSLVSVFSVQASYTNALWVAALTLCATASAWRERAGRRMLLMLVPGILAAISLLPYLPVLRQTADWAAAVRTQIVWRPFIENYLRDHSLVYPLLWAAASMLTIGGLFLSHRKKASEPVPPSASFLGLAAVVCLAVQVGFVQAAGIPPFPRYFMPALLISALAIDALTGSLKSRVRVGAAGLILMVSILTLVELASQGT